VRDDPARAASGDRMPRLIVFDCDGTLVDSQANIIRAMASTFAHHGLDAPDPARVRRVVGLSLVEAMQALLPDAAADQQVAMAHDYKGAFQRLRADGALEEEPLFDGIADLVVELAEAGFQLGVATGKSDRGLQLCLERHGLKRYFHTLQTADRHPSKPHPSMLEAAMLDVGHAPATTVMIGDTVFDIDMARAAGSLGLGVAWGYHAPEELADAGAHAIVDTAAELRDVLRRWAA